MAKWKEGWKVLRVSNRASIISNKAVKYLKNRVAKRPKNCGPLALFDTKSSAKIAFGWHLHKEIAILVKCEYLPSRCKTIWVPTHRRELQGLPPGTILAEKIRCLE